MARVSRPSNLFLIGFMGAGKSAVGSVLASRLGWDLADTDRMIVDGEGRSIDRIFAESGEGYFRRVEWEALESLAGRTRSVVATGGGLFLGAAQRRWIRRHGRSVWLDAAFDAVLRRVGQGPGRPRWKSGNSVDFRAFFEKRRAAYALADWRVDASPDDPERIAEAIRGLAGV